MNNSLIRASVNAAPGYVPGEQPRDAGVIKLNTNENPYPPSPAVREALAGLSASSLRLYPDPMCKALREAIARLHGCAPANVICGNGSDDLLTLCISAFVENDGAVGFLDPSYSLYPVMARLRGLRTVSVELGARFESRLPPEGVPCPLFFLTNPNAPTGYLCPKDEVRAFCRRQRGVVVIDEAYVDFASGDCMELALGLDNAICLRTLSKSHSLAGLRLGYAVGPEPLVNALFKVKESYNVDRITQALALAAISDPASMRAGVEKVKATRARFSRILSDMGFDVYPSESNFIWARPGARPAGEVYRELARRRIYVRHFEGPRTGDCIRITIGADGDMDALAAALRDMRA
ncbi:MAG: histidinol-phosphate transaminase [Lentisphaerae bacterium]|nr:histidinol-phosphate transaminase [Lentisphaerota bacterium]